MTKIKRYRLGVSLAFPMTHPKAGELTYFKQKIELALLKQVNPQLKVKAQYPNGVELEPKFHTIRANYPLWEKRMKAVQAGCAVIELFYWSGSPYNSKRDGSKQVVFATLDKDSGCGAQELRFYSNGVGNVFYDNGDSPNAIMPNELAKNDGLSLDDFKAWFRKADLSKPIAIIHFTKFRY